MATKSPDKGLVVADIDRFAWKRPVGKDAFSWQEEGHGLRLMARKDAVFEKYYPIGDERFSGLYLTFADLDGSVDQFIDFANQHGKLGFLTPEQRHYGEHFTDWKEQRDFIAHLLHIWDMVQAKDQNGLSEYFSWDSDEVTFTFPPVDTREASARKVSEMFATGRGIVRDATRKLAEAIRPCPKGDLVVPAVFFVQLALTRQLNLSHSYEPSMFWSDDEETLKIRPASRTLLGVLYLQFAYTLNGNSEFRKCAICPKRFKILPGVTRSDCITCSPTCKTKQYRRRMEKARELSRQGMTAREIVRELGVKADKREGKKRTAIKIVENWIAKGAHQ